MKIILSSKFTKWLDKLRDPVGYRAVLMRFVRLENNDLGDVKTVRGVRFS